MRSGRRAVRLAALAGLCVGSKEGERTLGRLRCSGRKALMLAGDVVVVEANEARVARGRMSAGSRRQLCASSTRTAARSRPTCRASTMRSSTTCSGSASSPRGRTCAARPAVARAPTRLAAGGLRVRPGGAVVYSVCTINADENEGSSTCRPPSPTRLARSGRSTPCRSARVPPHSPTPRPHRGFFIARLSDRSAGERGVTVRRSRSSRRSHAADFSRARRADPRRGLAPGARRLPLRRRRRSLRPAGDDRALSRPLDRAVDP